MKLLIIRHADPDYTIDSLTETGHKEAELLSQMLSKQDIKEFYVSPLGRAKKTAEYTLTKMGRTAIECDWLQEFPAKIIKPHREKEGVTWDWLPSDWTKVDNFYSYENWADVEIMKTGNVLQHYNYVVTEFDNILKKHGYERSGRCYKAVKPNNDTIAFFCHFGLECVLLSHLMCVSPMVLWHSTCALPSSVTTVITEERRKGVASFRVNGFGDVSHLYAKGESPSFSARFCETFENDERHD